MVPIPLIRTLSPIPESVRRGAVAIGNFDGVHVGHAQILRRLVASARDHRGPAVVFTFDPHPAELLSPGAGPAPLTWMKRRAELLARQGVDAVVACPTDRSMLAWSPEQFFQRVVCESLDARAIVEGPNFFFGRDRSGTVDRLKQLSVAAGIDCDIVEPHEVDGELVSSSRIRGLIRRGEIAAADRLLTAPYRICGTVERGAGRGASIGFATANLDPAKMLLPPLGVYAGRGFVDGQMRVAAIHLGSNPTFGENRVKFEVHLVGVDRALYGRHLEVEFLKRLRGVESFDGVDELRRQLERDVQAARDVVAGRAKNA